MHIFIIKGYPVASANYFKDVKANSYITFFLSASINTKVSNRNPAHGFISGPNAIAKSPQREIY